MEKTFKIVKRAALLIDTTEYAEINQILLKTFFYSHSLNFQLASALSTLWSRVGIYLLLFLALHFKPWRSSVLYKIASKMATLNSSDVENSTLVYNPSVHMQALYIMMFLILESVGNFLLFCMISYEKYVMDSQKRTVTNRLLSNICIIF